MMSSLTTADSVKSVNDLLKEKSAKKVGVLKWLISHYLYFRIPLIYPAKFLRDTLPVFRALSSRLAVYFYLLISMAGVFMMLANSSSYFSTFPRFFNVKGLMVYGIAVILIKAAHEFSHSYTATSFGVRVRSMGIAFMIFWPIPFCDVTDAWKLDRKKYRAAIGLAGVAAELVIAGITLFLWSLFPDGSMLKSVFFITSSASLISTLLVNLNPAMRFDGYYILSDSWGIENMQPRAFAITKWKLRKMLLGIDDPPPEKTYSAGRVIMMMAYSIYTWMYRIGLYIGIAILVYYKFTKAIGFILFATEILMFLLKPIYTEAKTLYAMRSRININLRLIATVLVIGSVITWVSMPLKRQKELPALVLPENAQTIYAPSSGKLYNLKIKRGTKVKEGDPLFNVYSEKILADLRITELERKSLQIQAQNLTEDETGRGLLPQKKEEIARADAKIMELKEKEKLNYIKSSVAGTVCEWDPSIVNNRFIKEKSVLGRISTLDQIYIHGYVPEQYLQDLKVGDKVFFMPADYPRKIAGTIRMINPVREEILKHKSLSSLLEGDIAVSPDEKGRLRMVDSYYRFEAELTKEDKDLRLGQSGRIWITTKPRSSLLDFVAQVKRV
ncbi:MAG: efflux RND transporter periplasmic adaptor subunit, partial [Planctomycetota bacterium]